MRQSNGGPWAARLGATIHVAALLLLRPAPAEANPLAPSWTGVYGGLQLGANWADFQADGWGSFTSADASGGLLAGYNIKLGGFVVGVEADASLDSTDAGLTAQHGGELRLASQWSGSLRGRAGITLGPALLYATAGYAWSQSTLTKTSASGQRTKDDLSFDGVVYGIGAETFVLPNLTLRLEALRYDYGTQSLSLAGAGRALDDISSSATVVRAGITLHLD